jgi:hypothetical protein
MDSKMVPEEDMIDELLSCKGKMCSDDIPSQASHTFEYPTRKDLDMWEEKYEIKW